MIESYGAFCSDCNVELVLLEDRRLVCPKCGHVFPPIERKGDMSIAEALLLARKMFNKNDNIE